MLPDMIERTIIKECKRAARAANLPKKFIDHIRLEITGDQYEIVNDWSEQEKPLAEFFNYGTTDHYVAPKNKKALAFKGEGTHGSAIYYRGATKSSNKGGVKFSKGHYVSGLPRTEAMEQGIQNGEPKLQRLIRREMNRKIKEYRSENVKGSIH